MAAVSFRNVYKSFGTVKVIEGVSIDVADGEFVVIVGPSGWASRRCCACWRGWSG